MVAGNSQGKKKSISRHNINWLTQLTQACYKPETRSIYRQYWKKCGAAMTEIMVMASIFQNSLPCAYVAQWWASIRTGKFRNDTLPVMLKLKKAEDENSYKTGHVPTPEVRMFWRAAKKVTELQVWCFALSLHPLTCCSVLASTRFQAVQQGIDLTARNNTEKHREIKK